jgi:hypothetical protein
VSAHREAEDGTAGSVPQSHTAQAGMCIDCHRTQNAQGKKAPTKCMECHKKENTWSSLKKSRYERRFVATEPRRKISVPLRGS